MGIVAETVLAQVCVCLVSSFVGHNRTNAGTRHRGTINNKDRIAATMYPLGTWFVWGMCVWIPCIKETMMMMIIIIMIMMIMIIIIIIINVSKQNRQCTYNVILRRVHVTIFFCSGKATMNEVCIVNFNAPINNIQMFGVGKNVLWLKGRWQQ